MLLLIKKLAFDGFYPLLVVLQKNRFSLFKIEFTGTTIISNWVFDNKDSPPHDPVEPVFFE